MDIWALKIFKTVAEEGNISRAAGKMNCVQSNVTARIRQLEKELGVALFYRKSRGVALTAKGEILVPYAEQAVRLLKDAALAVSSETGIAGPLTIGTMESTAAARLPGLLADYYQRYPQVELQISTGTTEELVNNVLEYSLEGAFVAGSIKHADIEQYRAFKEQLVIITEPGIESLTGLDHPTFLVFRRGCSYRNILESWAQENGIIPGKIMELGTLEGILGFVVAGMGITLFPYSVVANLRWEKMVGIHEISERWGKIATVFIRRKDGLLTKAMQAFIESLEN